MMDTKQLLAEHVATGSETAFRELVSRYVNLVHSAARAGQAGLFDALPPP